MLIVEDNGISQKLLRKQLVRARCSMMTANNGVEAVEFVLGNTSIRHVNITGDTGRVDAGVEIILMGEYSGYWAGYIPLIQHDIEMPRKGVIEAIQDIRSVCPDGRLSL